jgi:hypothetical protein
MSKTVLKFSLAALAFLLLAQSVCAAGAYTMTALEV